MTSTLKGVVGGGGSGKVDNSTDKLRDKGGGGGPKIRNFHGHH